MSCINIHMLQFLLDEHLPGYCLPKRRLHHDTWSIDPITCNIKVFGAIIISSNGQKNGVVAMKSSNVKDVVIICGDCSEYHVSTNGYYVGFNSTGTIQYQYVRLWYTAVIPSQYDFTRYLA